jgi:hypothetical protein
MAFDEKYLDVLQNIEFAIVQIYRQYPELHDYEVMNALEAAIDFYAAQRINRNPRDFNLSDRAALVAENVKNLCDWRLGRKSKEIDPTNLEGSEKDQLEMTPKTIDEIITCFGIHREVDISLTVLELPVGEFIENYAILLFDDRKRPDAFCEQH